MALYGIVTVNYLQEKGYKTKGVYSKTIRPYVIAGIVAHINAAYAIHQVSLNEYFTCKFSSIILSSKVTLSFRIHKTHSVCILNFMPKLT
jgi:hypothetical protein